MSAWEKISRSNLFIRLKSWEYWPFGIIQFPLFMYWLWLSVRSRSLLFFSASNPGIPMGGMFGESKFDILRKIPNQWKPKTLLIGKNSSLSEVLSTIQLHDLRFPLIFKPDLGERGFRVARISNEEEVRQYLTDNPADFIIQTLVDLPLEFGIFYSRLPQEEKGKVTSVVMKEMLTVRGDGRSTLRQLILAQDRAKLQWKKLKVKYDQQLEQIIPPGEMMELVSIGNHCLGTKFLNGNHLINDQLNQVFDTISKSIEGFYYGRFDLRCASLDDLYTGNVCILELNGCGAEPAHIYDPDYALKDAMADMFLHWKNIYEIARQNNQNGFGYTSLRDGLKYYRKFKMTVQ